MRRTLTLTIVMAAAALVPAGEALAGNQLKQQLELPAQLAATLEATNCATSPGPQISLQGEVRVPGVAVDVLFSHLPDASNPRETVAVAREVVPPDEPMAVAQQSIVGAIGNNPYIWLQLTDPRGKPLTSEIFLGRCDQGQFTPTIDFAIPAEALAEVSATDCDGEVGPEVVLDGQVQLSPLNGKLIFRSSDLVGGPGAGQSEAAIELVIMPTGPTYPFPQESLQAGVGGNPFVSAQLRQDSGEVIGREQRFGRCAGIVN